MEVLRSARLKIREEKVALWIHSQNYCRRKLPRGVLGGRDIDLHAVDYEACDMVVLNL